MFSYTCQWKGLAEGGLSLLPLPATVFPRCQSLSLLYRNTPAMGNARVFPHDWSLSLKQESCWSLFLCSVDETAPHGWVERSVRYVLEYIPTLFRHIVTCLSHALWSTLLFIPALGGLHVYVHDTLSEDGCSVDTPIVWNFPHVRRNMVY